MARWLLSLIPRNINERCLFAFLLSRPRSLRSFLHSAGANCRRERIKTFFGFYCTCYMLHDIKINEFIPECIGAKENHFSTHCVIIIFLHFYYYSFCGEFPNDPQTLCLRRKLSIAKVLMIAVSKEWLIWVFNRLSSWQRRPGRSANDVRMFISVTNVCFVFINTLGMEIAWLRWSCCWTIATFWNN